MLYTVVAIARSGSSSLCKRVALQYDAKNLGEVFFPFYGNNDPSVYVNKLLELIEISKNKNIVVKILVNKSEQPRDIIKVLLESSAKIFYCLRLDHAAHCKSILGSIHTKKFGKRKPIDKLIHLDLNGDIVESQGNRLIAYTKTQGQWFKEFPGELSILDEWGVEPYANWYEFDISKSTKEFLNPKIKPYLERKFDVLSIFYQGDINSSLN